MDDPLINASVLSTLAPSVRRSLFLVGYPACLQWIISFGTPLVAYVIVGRVADETTLAAFGLGNTLCNLCGRFLVYGVCSALDTYASQAWGANEPRKVGVSAQRALLIVLLFVALPLSAVWWFAAPILVALRQPTAVAAQTTTFARASLPGLYALSLASVLSRIFYALGKSRHVMFSELGQASVSLGLVFVLLVWPCQLGLLGAALAATAGNIAQALLLMSFAVCDREMRSCWPGLTSACLRGWPSFLILGGPACFMFLAEVLSWDIVTFLSGMCTTATGQHPDAPKTVPAHYRRTPGPTSLRERGQREVGWAPAGPVRRSAHTQRARRPSAPAL